MSEEEKFNSIIQEIKDIYIYLSQGEPTPDDEITAREKLINQIQTLKSIKTSDAEVNISLFEDTLNKLNNWDTLELWFVESELPQNIENIIKIKEEIPELEVQSAIRESETARLHEDLETASFDIDQIVNKVSQQFKGEIDDLMHKIDLLKSELEKKDETLQHVSQNKVIKKITPKKEVKLPPPKIKLPVFKKPDHPPHIRVPTKFETEKPRKAIGIKSIEEVQTKIEQELEKQKKSFISEKKPEIEEEIIQKNNENNIFSDISKDSESIFDILEESEISPESLEPPKFTKMPEKPKKSSLVAEIIEIDSTEEEKKIPFTIKESKIEQEPVIKEPKNIEKPPVVTKPKITPVSIEEIEAEKIRSTGTELFNVFSSVGEKSSEGLPTLNEALISPQVKDKKKRKEGKSSTVDFVGFNDSKPKSSIYTEPEADLDKELPSDKDSLYQELIALEGKRYSLEKNFKELEKTYSMGSIDDFEYKKQSEELRNRLNGITAKINKIRRVISSL
ncbi:MAG: hypothetical protein ACFFA4_11735 [Promethearchaeota archaeon]